MNAANLVITHPDVVKEWLVEKNYPLTPMAVTFGSHVKVWWGCQEGHTWLAQVSSRCNGDKSSGCPKCSVIRNTNNLVKKPLILLYPDIFNELENKDSNLGAASHKELAWVCLNGHKEIEKVFIRVNRGGCKSCHVAKGTNIRRGRKGNKPFPIEIASQWHPTKNLPLQLNQVSYGSTRRAWWLCGKGHEWEGRINARKSDICPECYSERILAFDNSFASKEDILPEWADSRSPDTVSLGSGGRVEWKCLKNSNHTWSTYAYQRGKAEPSGCPECSNNIFISKAEKDIANYLSNLSGDIELKLNDRKLLDNKYELDMYLPLYSLAIEYNGLYWHDENHRKNVNYHYDKYKACNDKGIQLIQIWEDEWVNKQSIIKSMLAHKLSLSQSSKIMGRKTKAIKIGYSEAAGFLDRNHIQGSATGSKYYALVDVNSTKVAVIVIKKRTNHEWEIVRYATTVIISGGFSKLLSYAEKSNTDITKWITFSDNCVSDGKLYENNGFIKDIDISPDYKYVVNGERIHKFNYRIKRFRNDPKLKYFEGYSESQLAKINNIPRIWDAGKIRWVRPT